MDDTTPEQAVMLAVCTLYVAITEAVSEMFGKDIEPLINRHIERAMPHLPEDAADMCGYLLGFASPRAEQRNALMQSSGGLFEQLATMH
jgi:hypothetical protein